MTAPETPQVPRSRWTRIALFLTIGTRVAAAILGAWFSIVGDQANIAGRAWLTLLLVLIFAGVVILDTNVARGPNTWYLPVSTIVNVLLLAVGLLKLWNGPLQPADTAAGDVWVVQAGRLFLVVLLLRLALILTQVYWQYVVVRAKSSITRVTSILTVVLIWVAALVPSIPAAFPEAAWPDWWWRIAGAAALVAVVMTVIPLIVRAFDPKEPKAPKAPPAVHPAAAEQYAAQQQSAAQQYAAQQYAAQQQAAQQQYAAQQWAAQQAAQAQQAAPQPPAPQPGAPVTPVQSQPGVPPVPLAPAVPLAPPVTPPT